MLHLGFSSSCSCTGRISRCSSRSPDSAGPALPSGVIDAVGAITILSLIAALVFRLNNKVMRFLSTGGDYVAWAVTLLPVLTGYLAYNHLLLPYTTMLAVHLLSVELLMVVAPFGKLTHMFSLPWPAGTRVTRPARGVES